MTEAHSLFKRVAKSQCLYHWVLWGFIFFRVALTYRTWIYSLIFVEIDPVFHLDWVWNQQKPCFWDSSAEDISEKDELKDEWRSSIRVGRQNSCKDIHWESNAACLPILLLSGERVSQQLSGLQCQILTAEAPNFMDWVPTRFPVSPACCWPLLDRQFSSHCVSQSNISPLHIHPMSCVPLENPD